jgi:hypothetical protein
MPRCKQCGAPFFSASPSWGGQACGDCLADRIELSLMHRSLNEQRKPMRKATSDEARSEVVRTGTERRSA